MITHPLRIVTGGLSFDRFLRVYRRWIMFSRAGLSFSFTWPFYLIATSYLVCVLLPGLALIAGQWLAAALAAAVVAVQGLSTDDLHRRFTGEPVPFRHAWMPWAIFLIAPVILISMARRDLGWRGRTYQLSLTTRLRNLSRPEAPRS
jgi:ceramide glucosyltransferase